MSTNTNPDHLRLIAARDIGLASVRVDSLRVHSLCYCNLVIAHWRSDTLRFDLAISEIETECEAAAMASIHEQYGEDQ